MRGTVRLPFQPPHSPVHQHGEYVWVIHQVTDLDCPSRQATGQRHFKLRSRQHPIDALPIAEKPNPDPFRFGRRPECDAADSLS